jgi:hypothetical protein
MDRDGWKIAAGGFVELDSITDSTRSFTESMNNAPVSRPDAPAGQAGRTQFSIRDSRLGFAISAPEFARWKTRGYFEFDFMGTAPSPGSASGTPEAGFFNTPALRARHAYVSVESAGWQLMAGQSWAMFGWQPNYFIPSLQVPAFPGMAFARTAQIRITRSTEISQGASLQAALGVMRPPQRDAELPGLEAGFRIAFDSRVSGYTGAATGPQRPQPMSLAVSATVREFAVPQNPANPSGEMAHYPGSALAIDFLLPVIASADGKEVADTLTLGGEFTSGTGYGDQFPGWTGNLANPLNSSKSIAQSNTGLDGGIGDFDSSGEFRLVRLMSANAYFQYHLPSAARAWVSGGYSWLYSDNVALLATGGKTSAGLVPYTKNQAAFVNVAHDLTGNIRVGAELCHESTTYGDGSIAHNNRYQASVWFIF